MERLEELPPFFMSHRPRHLNAASDALSRREQDVPINADNVRLQDRELQLLKDEWMNTTRLQQLIHANPTF